MSHILEPVVYRDIVQDVSAIYIPKNIAIDDLINIAESCNGRINIFKKDERMKVVFSVSFAEIEVGSDNYYLVRFGVLEKNDYSFLEESMFITRYKPVHVKPSQVVSTDA